MEDAMLAALLEAIQSRATDIAGARDDIRPADYALRAGPTPEIGSPLIAVPRDRPRIGPEPTDIASHLEAAGIGPVTIFDLSRPGSDICCVAVAVPGLEDGDPSSGRVMGPRTRRQLIRRALGPVSC
jgi:ribosomal protein S12 methylthiotransferase accessory factor